MAIIDSIDGQNRKIYLSADTVDASIHPIDIYKEMRTLRRENEDLRKYDVFMKAYGNIQKSATTATERYVVMQNGCTIVPHDTSHVLTITGTIITDAGQEGVYCFDRTALSDGVQVDINYQPKQVEIIYISGGSGLTQEEHDKLLSLDTDTIPTKVWEATDRTLTESGLTTDEQELLNNTATKSDVYGAALL